MKKNELKLVAQPFISLLAVIDKLNWSEEKVDALPLRDFMPGVWPTVGELRALVKVALK